MLAATFGWAQTPIANPSFEQGLAGWSTYTYQVTDAAPGTPVTGQIPATFGLLHPGSAPDGYNVCGIQSQETTGNGGVRQSFTWSGGAASISVDARAYSERYDGTAYNNGSLVRMGLAVGDTQDRSAVTWAAFPWSDSWSTRTIRVPGAGTYTLFIECYQPNPTAAMSTLWDNVQFQDEPPVLVTSGPTVTNDPTTPDTAVTVSWTTDTPSTSYVDFGPTSSYGATVGADDLATEHTVALTGLSHSSQYHFQARSAASGSIDWTSDDLTFNTPIWFSNIVDSLGADGHSMAISWTTDVPATTQVEYWSDVDAHTYTTENTTLATAHQATISGLVEGKKYSFRVWGRNEPIYTDASSDTVEFWTLPPVSQTLQNCSFENVGAGGQSIYPWVQYTVQQGSIGYHPIDGLVGPYPAGGTSTWLPSSGSDGVYFPGVKSYDGSYFIGAGANAAYKNGGVFQRVYVNPGDFYTLTARYLTHRSGGEDNYNKVRIGIDPNGGVDPASSNVRWWTGCSETNDNQWYSTAITVTAGSTGVATVFLEFKQQYAIEWHVEAIDGVLFDTPFPRSIGALKASTGSLGAVLEDKIVTYVSPLQVRYESVTYSKIYVEEADRTAGIAVLLPYGSGLPVVGNKLTVTGALGIYDSEAAFVAESWTVDPTVYALPKPMTMSQAHIGGVTRNQPAAPGKELGLCNVGLRVRLFGKVTSIQSGGTPGDMTVYIDDGTHLTDGTKDSGEAPIQGIRVYLYYNESVDLNVGDYIAVTGPLTIQLIDPDDWPGNGNEYYIYAIPTVSSDDWTRF